MTSSIVRLLSPVFVVFIALFVGLYQLRLKSIASAVGLWREVEPTDNRNCRTLPELKLKGCEQIILHQPTGLLYLACSDPFYRDQWMPWLGACNADNRSMVDYVAVYDPKTGEVRPITPLGFDSPRGLSLHGMDVITSSANPDELFIYLVNHRPPLVGDPRKVGADEAVELFRTRVGEDTMTHVHTFEDPGTMISLNDVVGSSDGQSVYYTNDASMKVPSIARDISNLLNPKQFMIGYCHKDTGCKVAIDNLININGIAKSPWNDTYYVSYPLHGGIAVLSRQADNRLDLDYEIPSDRGFDNLSVDDDGVVWAAGFPNVRKTFSKIRNPKRAAPSSIHRVSVNTDHSSFFGQKYQIEKVIEDDGAIISGATSVAHDARRKRIFIHGFAALSLAVCDL